MPVVLLPLNLLRGIHRAKKGFRLLEQKASVVPNESSGSSFRQ
jgi:hypothetical protein